MREEDEVKEKMFVIPHGKTVLITHANVRPEGGVILLSEDDGVRAGIVEDLGHEVEGIRKGDKVLYVGNPLAVPGWDICLIESDQIVGKVV
jgi:hypothetical protein